MESCYKRLDSALRQKGANGLSYDEAESLAYQNLVSSSRPTLVLMVCGALIAMALCALAVMTPMNHDTSWRGAVAFILAALTGAAAGYVLALIVQITSLVALCKAIAEFENRYHLAAFVFDSFPGAAYEEVPFCVWKVINSEALKGGPVSPVLFFKDDGRLAFQYAAALATLRRALFLTEGRYA